MKTVLELDHKEARRFFLDNKSYVNFDLPEYFDFSRVLQSLSTTIGKHRINEFFEKNGKVPINPKDEYGVNRKILGNKDGELAWRPFEIINPALYVALVHLITEESHWELLRERFKVLKVSQIDVASIPVQKSKKKSAKAEQIRAWWEKFEQNCVAQGLEFDYVYETDVADCYSSIYTHAITWAIYGKDNAYANRGNTSSLGYRIDEFYQMMHHRQTNGIPQGSTLSDFIAELIFAYVDNLLVAKIDTLKSIQADDYRIIRYRDDYRIFTNKPDVGARILKELTEILADVGLKLNSQKTKRSDDIIRSSVKADKIDELFIPNIKQEKDNFAKWLMQIYASTHKHPNSGKTSRQLTQFHKELLEYVELGNSLRHYERADVMMSIVTNIALRNPRYYNVAMAVASVIVRAASGGQRKQLLKKTLRKFDNTPNTGLLDIWVQRISYAIDPDKKFDEPLTDTINGGANVDNGAIWNTDWLKPILRDLIKNTSLVDVAALHKIQTDQKIAMSIDEVDLFTDIPS